METIKLIAFIASAVPIFCLAIFILLLAIKQPVVISESSKYVNRERPDLQARGQRFLTMFYMLDGLRESKKNKYIYVVGLVGVIGTSILLVCITIYSAVFILFP